MQKSNRLLDAFIANLRSNERSDDTIYQYISTLRHAERFFISEFNIPIFEMESISLLTKDMIGMWVAHVSEQDISLATRASYFYRMRSYLHWLFEQDIVLKHLHTSIPSLNGQVQRRRNNLANTDKVYSDDDITNMLEIAESNRKPMAAARNSAIIAMFAGTGMRSVEVLSLTVGQYKSATETHVLQNVTRKGGGIANIPFASFVAPYVDRYLALRGDVTDSDPLFVSLRANTPLSRGDARAAIAEIQKAAGVKTGLHNFRHTLVTRIAETNPTGIASAIAGHTSIRTTENNYIHAAPEQIRSVVDSLSINHLLSKDS